MSIKMAETEDFNIVKHIAQKTIGEIYPHYYPEGAVKFFLEHHSDNNIIRDIEQNSVFLCLDKNKSAVGTVTIKNNEICRLFVLPDYQGNGYGREMLIYAEDVISRKYSHVILDASLPAKKIYLKRGYTETETHTIKADYGDYLCYDVMTKQL